MNNILLNKLARRFTICGILFSIIVCEACSSEAEDALDAHKDVVIEIEPGCYTNPLNNSHYSIDSVRSLSMPANKVYKISKLVIKDNKIYLLDTEFARTVFVFNTNGDYLYKLGERGRAINEYIGEPNDFFVDKHDEVHVFDRNGKKIIVFKNNGKIARVVGTYSISPYSFGLIDYNKYAYCIQCPNSQNRDVNPALLFSDASGVNKKNILCLRNTYTYIPSERLFFKNDDRLSHIPIMSDSVLVFKNDSIEKVIHFDFKGKFLAKEKPNVITSRVKSKEISNYNGVWGLIQYQETNFISMLEYLYDKTVVYWFNNKKNGQIINSRSIMEGICPFSCYYLRDNQIVAVVDKETVKEMNVYAEDDTYKKKLRESSPQIIDVLEGKIPTPAIIYISIK